MDPKQFRVIIKEELKPVIKTQQEHSEKIGSLTEKVDSITAELHDVHELANATLDVVKGRYEKNKSEIDEIKDHLHLPKKPYFGE